LQILVSGEDLFGNITTETIRLLDGKIPPALELESPADGSFYEAGISIEGRVADPYGADPKYGGIDRIEYEMTSARFQRNAEVLKGTIRPEKDGRFSQPLNTVHLRDEQRLTLRIYASNGNVAEKHVVLKEGGSGIPSFSATPRDGYVRLDWDYLPFAESYSLKYVEGGPGALDPAVETAADVAPPLLLRNLENGARYSFILTALIQGTRVSSEIREVIPLSPRLLKPEAKGEFQQIELRWNSIPGAESFILYRAEDSPDDFSPLATVQGNTYLDASVQYGTEYYYRVSPADGNAPAGEYTTVSSLAAPSARVTAVTSEEDFVPVSITVFGEYACMPAGDKGLRILDVSDPARSFLRGSCTTDDAKDVAVRGDFAYLADGRKGIKIINIIDPQNPIVVGSRNTQDATAVAASGDYAYVADRPGGLRVLDIRNPGSPARIATLDIEGAVDCVVQGRFVYVAGGKNGVRIVDISVPGKPVEKGSFFCADARGLKLKGESLFVADAEEGLIIMDVSNPEHPDITGRAAVPGARGLEVKDQYVFIAAGENGLVVIDALDPRTPQLFDEISSSGALNVGIKDDFALLADASGLRVIRTYLFGRSFRISGLPLGGTSTGISVEGGRAFVSSHAGGVHIIYVSRPDFPETVSPVPTLKTGYAEATALWEGNLIVMDGEGGVQLYTEPWDRGPLVPDLPGYAFDAAIDGSILYPTLGSGGIGITDLSPLKKGEIPEEVGRIDLPDTRAVCIAGSRLLVADGKEGFVVYSDNAGRYERISSLDLRRIKDVAFREETAAVVGSGGLVLIDISDTFEPVRVGLYPTMFAESVCASKGYFYLSEGYKGLSVLTVSQNGRPMRISTCPTVYAVDSAVQGDYAYVADGKGLSVVRIIVPEWLALLHEEIQ